MPERDSASLDSPGFFFGLPGINTPPYISPGANDLFVPGVFHTQADQPDMLQRVINSCLFVKKQTVRLFVGYLSRFLRNDLKYNDLRRKKNRKNIL